MGGSFDAFWQVRRFARSGPVEGAYRCQGCESEFDVEYHVCPDCGGFSVESTAVVE